MSSVAVNAFLGLDDNGKRQALAGMSPEAKQRLLTGIKGQPTLPEGVALSYPSTSAPNLGMGHPVSQKNWADHAADLAPMLGGTLGGIAGAPEGGVGAVPGAAIGGMIGGTLGRGLQARFGSGSLPVPPTAMAAATDVGLEGAKQGAYELGGRAVGALVGRGVRALRGVPTAPVGEVIAGTQMPETVGQAFGKPGGLTQTIEHYLSRTWVGQPLKDVAAAQEQASREIMAHLSGSPGASSEKLAANWAEAREATRAMASPLYEQVAQRPLPGAAKVATDILDNETLRLSPKAKQALTLLGSRESAGADAIAKGLGYPHAKAAAAGMGEAAWGQYSSRVAGEAGINESTATVGDAIAARHELMDQALRSAPSDKRVLLEAAEQLDGSISAALSPEEQAMKRQADTLWRRSYIMDRISRGLEKMENVQDPKEVADLATKQFTQMVNRMARGAVTHDTAGNIVRRPSELDVLFDNPADRQAMIDLSSFLTSKASTLRGQSGISESIARIGVAEEAVRGATTLLMGNPVGAAKVAGGLATLYGLAHILANPGGAVLMKHLFEGTAGVAGAAALRTGGAIRDYQATSAPPAPPQ